MRQRNERPRYLRGRSRIRLRHTAPLGADCARAVHASLRCGAPWVPPTCVCGGCERDAFYSTVGVAGTVKVAHPVPMSTVNWTALKVTMRIR